MTNEINVGNIERRGVESGYSIVEVRFEHPEEGLIVGEKLASVIAEFLPEVASVKDTDYAFFEGWKSKTRLPGFAVYGKKTDTLFDKGEMHYILKVVYESEDPDDVNIIPERFLSEEERAEREARKIRTNPGSLKYLIETPFTSPLYTNTTQGYVGLESLLQTLKSANPQLGMGTEFYQQFTDPSLTPESSLSDEVLAQLRKQDNFNGRYVVVVSRTNDDLTKCRFDFGYFRSGDTTKDQLDISDKSYIGKDRSEGFLPNEIVGIYGKGMEPIYVARKSPTRNFIETPKQP